MRRYVRLGACSGLLALVAVVPAWGQTFSYSEDFNDWGNMPSNGWGPVPIGWSAWDNGYWAHNFVGTLNSGESNPRVFAGDYARWAGDYTDDGDWSHSVWGHLGYQNYGVPWSGGARYSLVNAGWDPNYINADAWYTGVPQAGFTAKHTGTYPMDLQNNKLKATFDVSVRSGGRPSRDPTSGANNSASGGLFAIQPAASAADIAFGGPNGGWLGWGATGGLPGFAVEFDIQPSGGDPAASADGNHIGIDAMINWRGRTGLGDVPSVASNLDAPYGAALPFDLLGPCDNNQPLHVTVYYNDPAESPDGTLGWVRVYLKVKASDKAAGDPVVPADLAAPYSFGEGVNDPPDGILVAQACVGTFPGKAVFGFSAAMEHFTVNSIFMVDNVTVVTNPVSGNVCTPTWPPAYNADPQARPVTLDVAGKVADNTAGLSVPGWTCYTYPGVYDYWNPGEGLMAWSKGGISTCDAAGLGGPGVVEKDINWIEQADGQEDNIPYSREWPGMPPYDNQWYCVLAKGYIYFPVAGTFSLDAAVDDGFELVIGNQCIVANSGAWGWGLEQGTIVNLTVGTPGVYPIQFIGYEGYGGSNCEFYRRTGNPLVPFVAIGASNYGIADQPVVYSKLSGSLPATNLAAAGAVGPLVYTVATATLDTSVRMGDPTTASGAAALTMTKLVYAPNRWYWDGSNGNVAPDMTYAIDQWSRTNEVHWLDFLQNRTAGTTLVGTLRFGGPYWPECAWAPEFPEWNGNARAIGARFEGYLVFPTAGDYWLGVESEDGSYLWIGEQLIFETMSFDEPGKIMHLVVPQAGVYPVRVDFASSLDSRLLVLYQVVPGHSKVLVNDATSTIKFAQSCSAGSYVWSKRPWPIPIIPPPEDPQNHKVAEVGQGGNVGFNGTLTKFTDSAVDIWYQGQVAMWKKGADPKAIAYPTAHSLASLDATMVQQTAVVEQVNFWTQFDPADFACCEGMPAGFLPRFVDTMQYFGDYFPAISTDPGVNEDRFAVTFEGYIEFAQAGDYMFNGGTSDGLTIWIGGQVVTCKSWTNGWPYDSNPGFFHVATPGIYDIRVDYFQQLWNSLVNVFMWLPDGRPVLLNSADAASAGVLVYADLAPGVQPATTFYKDPTVVPASTKVAEYTSGGVPGYHVMVASETISPGTPVPYRGYGYELMTTLYRADKLLGILLDGDAPSPSMTGTLTDYVTAPADPLFLCPDCGAPGQPFPGPGNQRDHVAARVNGYMALKAGGHMLSICTDDGSRLVIGGQLAGPEMVSVAGSGEIVKAYKRMVGGQQIGTLKLGNVGTRHQDEYYVYVEEDGIYPFEVTYNNGWGGAVLVIRETPDPLVNDGNVMEANYEYPNFGKPAGAYTNTFTKVYITLCNKPWADANGDGDVDQEDFGVFQACFTGTGYAGPSLNSTCHCLDRGNGAPDGSIDAFDMTAFLNCLTGPAMPMNLASPPAGCTP